MPLLGRRSKQASRRGPGLSLARGAVPPWRGFAEAAVGKRRRSGLRCFSCCPAGHANPWHAGV